MNWQYFFDLLGRFVDIAILSAIVYYALTYKDSLQ